MKIKSTICAALLVAIILTFLPISASAAEPKALRPAVLQLRWDHQFQFAGYYAAKWLGYYEQAGLDVEIRSAVTSEHKVLQVHDELLGRRADFGIGGAELLVEDSDNRRFVLVASIFQQSPVAVFTNPSANITSPAQLVGRRVLRVKNDLTDVELQAMMISEGIDPDSLKSPALEPNSTNHGIEMIRDGQIDAYTGYTIAARWQAKQLGFEVSALYPAAYGIDFYGDSIFTTKRLAETEPEVVESFRKASLKGWAYALEHPEEIAKRISRELTRRFTIKDLLAYNRLMVDEVRRLMLYPVVEIGHVNPGRWSRMHDILRSAGLARGDLDIGSFVFHTPPKLGERATAFIRGLLVALLALGLAAAALVAISYILRRQVAVRTRQLEEEVVRRKAEERRMQRVFNSMFAFIGLYTLDGILIEANRAPLERAGLKRGDVIGKPFWATPWWEHSPLEQMRIRETLAEAAKGQVSRQDYTVKLSGGEIIVLDTIFAPLKDDSGSITQILGFGVDVTDRKNAESEMERERDFAWGLIATAPVVVLLLDRSSRVRHVNRQFEELTGYESHEVIGRDWIKTFIPSRDQTRIEELFATSIAGENIRGYVNPILKRNGSEILIEWHCRTLAAPYDEASVLAIGLDVTDQYASRRLLAESERRLIAAQRIAKIGSWEWRTDTGEETFSDEIYRIFGVEFPVGHLCHSNLLDLLDSPDRRTMQAAIGNALQLGQSSHFELRISRSGGERLVVLAYFDPIYSDDRTVIGVTGVFHDVSEQRRMEEQLRQTRKLEAIGRVTGGIAHDFNNLAGVILGNAELLREKSGNYSDFDDLIDRIVDAVSSGRKLTQQLLSFARMQTLNPVYVDVGALFKSVLSMAERLLDADISVRVKIPKGIGSVYVDEAQLKSALLNLIINARDSMPEGGTIVISAKNVDLRSVTDIFGLVPGVYLRIAVEDNGAGIPPDILERVTEPFFTTKNVGEGTGLGLSTAQGFAAQSGGALKVESETGVGTRVSIYLPNVPLDESKSN